MRVVFMGTPEYARVILEYLIKEFEVVGVFTNPDKAVGRKQILTPSRVKEYIIKQNFNIPIFQPKSLKQDEVVKKIISLKPDFIIVAAYGHILPKEILQIAPCINLHASILPKYRGASPIQSAILNGDELSGVTAMLMDVGLDDGDILGFKFLNIKDLMSFEIFDKMAYLAGELAVETINNFMNIKPNAQDHNEATYCKKIKKEDGMVNFCMSVNEIYNKFRAYNPWPGIFLPNLIKLLEINIKKYSNLKNIQVDCGVITNITKRGFYISCVDGEIEILRLQEPSKKPILATEFINGKRLRIGDRIY